MLVLGIEGTAHTFGIGIAEKKGAQCRILSNELAKSPSTKAGYLPRKLADLHAKNFPIVLKKALSKSGRSISEIDAIAFSRGPGIGHCLNVAFTAARSLSLFLGVPLVPVNHAAAHAVSVKLLAGANDPLVAYVSGGNTQIFYREGKKFRVIGETLDIGMGNFLDQLGRSLNLAPPDAVGVLLEAKKSQNLLELPYVVKGMSTSYSGLLTFLQRLHAGNPQMPVQDLCYSAQETAFSAFCEATERALLHSGKREILLCGGNARNRRLQEMMRLVAQGHGAEFVTGEDAILGDNGAMIALTGAAILQAKSVSREIEPKQDMRVDGEEIPYW
ncbi:MAG: tRNA (adenosine(37)-N6)-threonylcarbamoyltransferase complex transferase subunit TsaD [Candidatus Micrarchaeia archaeon]